MPSPSRRNRDHYGGDGPVHSGVNQERHATGFARSRLGEEMLVRKAVDCGKSQRHGQGGFHNYSSRRTSRGFWPRMRKLASQPETCARMAVSSTDAKIARASKWNLESSKRSSSRFENA